MKQSVLKIQDFKWLWNVQFRDGFVTAQTTGLAGALPRTIVDLHIRKELSKSGSSLSGAAR
jgi:hypothetical protein